VLFGLVYILTLAIITDIVFKLFMQNDWRTTKNINYLARQFDIRTTMSMPEVNRELWKETRNWTQQNIMAYL
jgi:hypothetical protein